MYDKTCFSWVQVVKKSEMPPMAKYLCLYLSTFMNLEHNVAWPSQTRIVTETGMDIRTARKWQQWLVTHGWLIVNKGARPVMTEGGVQMCNEYVISLPTDVKRGIQKCTHPDEGGCKNVSEGGTKMSSRGVQNSTPNNNSNNKRNNKGARFAPPSVDDVKSYCREKNLNVNPEKFVDHYTTNGWMVGKTKMKDWKAACRNWSRRNDERNIDERDIDGKPWHESFKGVNRQGEKYGIKEEDFDNWQYFKRAVIAEAKNRGEL